MSRETQSSIPKSKLGLPVVGRDHIQGPMNAPVTLLEYGDYQCPACGGAYPMVKSIQKRLGDRLCFSFRNFPLNNIHPWAEHAAETAEAAAEQGRFWEMHDLLFENQDALDDESLARYAAELGLDTRRVVEELVAGAHSERVKEDFRGGARGGVNDTPTFFINGVRYDGPLNGSALMAALTESD